MYNNKNKPYSMDLGTLSHVSVGPSAVKDVALWEGGQLQRGWACVREDAVWEISVLSVQFYISLNLL